jgi:hypothetical protein
MGRLHQAHLVRHERDECPERQRAGDDSRPPTINTAVCPIDQTSAGTPPVKYDHSCIRINAPTNARFRPRKRSASRSWAFDAATRRIA